MRTPCRQLQLDMRSLAAKRSSAEADLQATIGRLEADSERVRAQHGIDMAKLRAQLDLLEGSLGIEAEKASRAEVTTQELRERVSTLEDTVRSASEEAQSARQVLYPHCSKRQAYSLCLKVHYCSQALHVGH
jgi:chromosome segregation ATPase